MPWQRCEASGPQAETHAAPDQVSAGDCPELQRPQQHDFEVKDMNDHELVAKFAHLYPDTDDFPYLLAKRSVFAHYTSIEALEKTVQCGGGAVWLNPYLRMTLKNELWYIRGIIPVTLKPRIMEALVAGSVPRSSRTTFMVIAQEFYLTSCEEHVYFARLNISQAIRTVFYLCGAHMEATVTGGFGLRSSNTLTYSKGDFPHQYLSPLL